MSYQSQGSVLEFKDGIISFRIQKNNLRSLSVMIGFQNGTPNLGGGRLVAYDIKYQGTALNQINPTIVEKARIAAFNYSVIPEGGISFDIPFIFDAMEFVIEDNTTNPDFSIRLGGNMSLFFVESL